MPYKRYQQRRKITVNYLQKITSSQRAGDICLVLGGNAKSISNALGKFKALGHKVMGGEYNGSRIIFFADRNVEVNAAMKTIGSIVKANK
jgi:hypothetical protein